MLSGDGTKIPGESKRAGGGQGKRRETKGSAQSERETRGGRGQGKGWDVGQSATNALLSNFSEKTQDHLDFQCFRPELPLQRKAF